LVADNVHELQDGRANQPWLPSDIIKIVWSIYVCFLLAPLVIIGNAYSLIFPIMCLIAYPFNSISNLQLILTFIYIGSIAILLALSRSVYRFKYCLLHTVTYYGVAEKWIDEIVELYSLRVARLKMQDALTHLRNMSVHLPKEIISLACSYLPDEFSLSQQANTLGVNKQVADLLTARRKLQTIAAEATFTPASAPSLVLDDSTQPSAPSPLLDEKMFASKAMPPADTSVCIAETAPVADHLLKRCTI